MPWRLRCRGAGRLTRGLADAGESPVLALGAKLLPRRGHGSSAKVSGWGQLGDKGRSALWPPEVIQKLLPFWAPPGPVQKPMRRKAFLTPIQALETFLDLL